MTLDRYGKKAIDLVMQRNSLFITGKAGTGKTTVLRELARQCNLRNKKVVILAPTGVAAKNAGGVTIHSFLHLPLGPYIPGMRVQKLYSLNKEEIEIVKRVDIMIIDEVSMVRCDLLDEIDNVLKHYRNNDLPFGGIQIVLFGDLYQLMPVATDEDWDKLKKTYDSQYFFSSKILKEMALPLFELKIIHRQDDRNFVTLLNNVRLGKTTSSELKELEGRYIKDFTPDDSAGYIRLTTHNWRAKSYNTKRLEDLHGELFEYKAYIEDFFPKEDWPTSYNLKLKRGARVMFIKNDNENNQYVNGTLGSVVGLGYRNIMVETDEGVRINVERQTWDFYRYHINQKTKEIEAILCGSFKQYPLKLAWAVTIHKSQGLTFDKVIIDAGKAFAPGQVYVALSRCRRFHGIVLVSPITQKIIKTDPIVKEYMCSVPRLDGGMDKSETDENEHLSLVVGADKTLWMLKDGLSLEDIAKQSQRSIEIIYGDLAKLIEAGKVNIESFIPQKLYQSIDDAIMAVGIDAPLKDIKKLCPPKTKFAEIRMVIADIKRQGKEDDYNEQDEDDSEWFFVSEVEYTKTSKRFLSYDCRVLLTPSGYYLEVTGDYIKLGDYPDGYDESKGALWIKKPLKGTEDFRMVHDIDGTIHLIGYIREDDDEIIFTNPDGKSFIITMN